MAGLPVQSVRAKPEHRDILQKVAELLREGGEPALRQMVERVQERPVGPFVSEQAAVSFLRDRLVANLRPKAVWLFGSRARGTARADSDFDLLVVLPDGLSEDAYSSHVVASPVSSSGIGFDIVPCPMSDFVRDKEIQGSLVQRATSEGRPLYLDREMRRHQAA
jgi:predicted nucleotidyltransferase